MTTNLMATVAGHLRAIVTFHAKLETEAVNSANDPLMPGGKAMVELAYVGSPETWTNRVDGLERRWVDYLGLPAEIMPDWTEAEDDSWEPPLQSLLFWSERWREERGYPLEGRRPTIATESNFLSQSLEWAWNEELHFEAFAEDMRKARRRIEDTLSEGERVAFRGVPCLYEECRGASLIRKTVPACDKDGNKIWRLTDWHCPRCKRSWTEEEYTRNIYAAILRNKIEQFGGDLWCTVDHAASRVGRPQGTLRSWITRGEVSAACKVGDRRTFVRYGDVEKRDLLAKARHASRVAVMASKRITAA